MIVAIVSAVACTLAIAALAFSYFSQGSEISTAARNSCELFRFVVLAATPPKETAAAFRLIDATPLKDCRSYAHNPVSTRALEHRLELERKR